jgi:ketosteroid isomerase-like protein
MSAREIVAETLRRWATQDVESAFEFVADDVVYVLNIDDDLAPFAGVRHGREAMMEAFYQMIEHYDYLKWDQVIVGAEGDVVRVQTQFRLHHRRTGTDLEGSMRTVITMRDGLMVRCEEFLDRGMVESFMKLAQQREANNQIVHPPEIPPRRGPKEDTRTPVQMTADGSDKETLEERPAGDHDKERCGSR